MQSDAALPTSATSPSDFKPEKARLDFGSVKVGMFFGMILVLIACLDGYWNSFKLGFLLSDSQHVDYAARAILGHGNGLAESLFYGSSGSHIFDSFSPVPAFSFLLDYLFWGTNAFGYHITNLLFFYACCVLIGLITLELTGLTGNRLGAAPAVWAALLFAVYPLHPQDVAWISGRNDLICGFFYLLSVFCYFRFRLLKEKGYLSSSALASFVAMLCNEMALTLPAVICWAEFCLWPASSKGKPATVEGQQSIGWFQESFANRLRFIADFFILLIIYAGLRIFIMCYLAPDAGSVLLSNLFSSASAENIPLLGKLALPIHEQVKTPAFIAPVLSAVNLAVLVLMSSRLAARSLFGGPLIFAAGWTAILLLALVPALSFSLPQHSFTGNTLFFLPSVPVCILLVLSALPAVDAIRKKQAATMSLLGALVLLVAFLTYTELLQVNMRPWRAAAKIAAEAGECPFEIDRVPFARGGSGFLVSRDGVAGLSFIPSATVVAKTDRWTVLTAGAGFVEPHGDFLRIFPGSKGLTVLLPAEKVSPAKCSRAVVDVRPPVGSSENPRKQVHLVLQAQPGNAGLRIDPGDSIVDFYGLETESLNGEFRH